MGPRFLFCRFLTVHALQLKWGKRTDERRNSVSEEVPPHLATPVPSTPDHSPLSGSTSPVVAVSPAQSPSLMRKTSNTALSKKGGFISNLTRRSGSGVLSPASSGGSLSPEASSPSSSLSPLPVRGRPTSGGARHTSGKSSSWKVGKMRNSETNLEGDVESAVLGGGTGTALSTSSSSLPSKLKGGSTLSKKSSFLKRRPKQEAGSGAFSRAEETGARHVQAPLVGYHFEGTPVVQGNFPGDYAGGEMPTALNTSVVRLEGIPGGIVRAVHSSESTLGLISQTNDLYVAGAPDAHFSALGQAEPVPASNSHNKQPASEGSATTFRLARVRGVSAVRRVALGDNHSACLCEDGRVYTWGMNVADKRWLTQDPAHGKPISAVITGQLGLGLSDKRWSSPMPVDGITGALIDVAVGSSHTVVLSEDGVFTCGNQMTLGRPNTDIFDCFMPVPGLASIPVCAVACGWDHTLVVTKDTGAVYSWGLNDHGQLGHSRQCKFASEPLLVADSKVSNGRHTNLSPPPV
jgi:hypothetical protein